MLDPTQIPGLLLLYRPWCWLKELDATSPTCCPFVRTNKVLKHIEFYSSFSFSLDKSYPAELLIFLDRLGEKWEFFALFLGFTNGEVRDIRRRSFGKTQQEIKNFSKVWRMPDVEQETEEILHRVLNAANIIIGKYYTHLYCIWCFVDFMVYRSSCWRVFTSCLLIMSSPDS